VWRRYGQCEEMENEKRNLRRRRRKEVKTEKKKI
jgi:hypothetical protein